jgi:hypothetical protein
MVSFSYRTKASYYFVRNWSDRNVFPSFSSRQLSITNYLINTMKFHTLLISATCFLATLCSGLSATAKPKIADDGYFHAAPSDNGFIVKGNRYYWPDPGENTPPAWRSTSELRQVKTGVILVGNQYFCAQSAYRKITKNKTGVIIAQCTKNGWKVRR